MLVGWEEVEHPVDRLGRVDGVDRREHEVAGLGRRESRVDGLLVAHLADQDHVRILAQDASQGPVEGLRVGADLTLVDDRALVPVEELDRVLDRHDVARPGLVDLVDDRRERRRLAGAGRPRQQDDAPLLVGQLADHRREREVLDRPDRLGDRPRDDRHDAALAEGVDPKPTDTVDLVGEVDFRLVVELGEAALVVENRVERGLGLRDAEHLPAAHVDVGVAERAELAVDPGERRSADFDVEVRSFAGYQLAECLVDVEHVAPIGVGRRVT